MATIVGRSQVDDLFKEAEMVQYRDLYFRNKSFFNLFSKLFIKIFVLFVLALFYYPFLFIV